MSAAAHAQAALRALGNDPTSPAVSAAVYILRNEVPPEEWVTREETLRALKAALRELAKGGPKK